MKKSKNKRPSQTRHHRESVAAKRKARAFYRMRRQCGADVLPGDEAEALRPWRGCDVAMAAIVATALASWIAVQLFS